MKQNSKLVTATPYAAMLAFVLGTAPAQAQVTPADVIVAQSAELDGYNAGRARQDEYGRPEYDDQEGTGGEHYYASVCGDEVLIGFTGSYNKTLPSGYRLSTGVNKLQAMFVAGRLTAQGLVLGEPRDAFPLLDDSDEQRDGLKPIGECFDPVQKLWAFNVNSPKDNPRGDDESRNWVAVFTTQDDANGRPTPVQLTTEVPFMANNNDNCADTDYGNLRSVQTDPGQYRFNFVGSCNGSGDDDAWHTKFNISCTGTNCSVQTDYDPNDDDGYKEKYESNIERNRPVFFPLSTDRFLVMGTDGNNQPPENGIKARVLNADTLLTVGGATIAAREDEGGFLNTMVHAAQVSSTDFIVSYQTRDRGNGDDKGPALLMLGKLRATPDGNVQWLKEPQARLFPGAAATHHTMCEVPYGDPVAGTEQMAAVLLTTSTHGGSHAQARVITTDTVTHDIVHEMTVSVPVYHDNMTISHYYGNNPGTQGKNSQYCTSIDNPAYQNPSSPYADVRSFMLFPAATRRRAPGSNTCSTRANCSEKLALDVALVPMSFVGNSSPSASLVSGLTAEQAFSEIAQGVVPEPPLQGASGRGINATVDPETMRGGSGPGAQDPSQFNSAATYPLQSGGCSTAAIPSVWWVAAMAFVVTFTRRRRRRPSAN